jgi:hypothetical protein
MSKSAQGPFGEFEILVVDVNAAQHLREFGEHKRESSIQSCPSGGRCICVLRSERKVVLGRGA